MRAPDILSRPSPAFSASPSSLTHYLSAAALVCTTATRTFHPCVCTQAPKTRYRLPDRFSSRPFSLPPTTSPTCSPLIALYIFSLFFLPFPFSLFFFLVIDREPRTQSRTPSRSNRDFTIRWKAVTGRPFRPPIHFRVAIQRYWSGRIERGPARVYIYTCTHRTKSGRETRERTRGR